MQVKPQTNLQKYLSKVVVRPEQIEPRAMALK